MEESRPESPAETGKITVIASNLTDSDQSQTEEAKYSKVGPVCDEISNESQRRRLELCTENRDAEVMTGQTQDEVANTKNSCTNVEIADGVRYSLCPAAHELPLRPPSSIESNYARYFAIDFLKPAHDQYVYRHANGLCVIGMASTHVAFGSKPQIKTVDFNVGKSSRSDIKVTGKRKRNAHHLEANSALCKVLSNETFYIIRCCVKGSLLEVNERLIKNPELLNTSAASEGYIAIMMPKPEDWVKAKSYLLTREQYKEQRGLP